MLWFGHHNPDLICMGGIHGMEMNYLWSYNLSRVVKNY